jgi:hypothetical protein
MANLKKALYWGIFVEGDGTDKTVVVSFATDPVLYSTVNASGFLNMVVASLPADVPSDSVGVTGALGIASASYDSLLHQLTVTFNSAPADDSINTLFGIALY